MPIAIFSNQNTNGMSETGLTLPELIITVLIIGIVASITFVSISNPRSAGIQNACNSAYSAVQLAISSLQSDSPTVRPRIQELTSLGYLNNGLLENNNFKFSIPTWSDTPTVEVRLPNNTLVGNAPGACKELR